MTGVAVRVVETKPATSNWPPPQVAALLLAALLALLFAATAVAAHSTQSRGTQKQSVNMSASATMRAATTDLRRIQRRML